MYGMKFQLSKYHKIYSYKEKPDHRLLFSTKRASYVLIPESILKSIEDKCLKSSDADTLSSLGFLVPDLNLEKKKLLGFTSESGKYKNFHAIVVLTLDCNLACKYCFEGKMKGKHYMSSETADQLIDFAETFLAKGKDINIYFYGGEPLLSFNAIKYISKKLKALADEKGLQYTFGLITNGTLLTRDKVEELLSYGLKGARVTIDGIKENHDIYRPLKSGTGSFDIIIRNIMNVCEITDIQIGGNYTQKNYKDFPHLLDHLIERGITPGKVSVVKFDPITKIIGEFALPDFRDGLVSINEPWIIEASIYLREEILKRGFDTLKIIPSPCSIEFKDDIIINYDGTLYKCPAFIGREGFDVGNLRTGIKDYRESHNLDSWKTEECLNCEYLPLCFGGCRLMNLMREGNIKGIDCRKPYLDATLEAFIKQEIKYKVTADIH
jgi:uncharacterized protein